MGATREPLELLVAVAGGSSTKGEETWWRVRPAAGFDILVIERGPNHTS